MPLGTGELCAVIGADLMGDAPGAPPDNVCVMVAQEHCVIVVIETGAEEVNGPFYELI